MTPPTKPSALPLLESSLNENNQFKGDVARVMVFALTGTAVWAAGAYYFGWSEVPAVVREFAVGVFFLWLLLKVIRFTINHFVAHVLFLLSEQLAFYSAYLFPQHPFPPAGPDKDNVVNLFDGPPAA